MENKIAKLIHLRPFILFMEIAGILHDIGKLSRQFLEYRTKWQKKIDGWDWYNDPHLNFLDQIRSQIKKYHPRLDEALSLSLKDLFREWKINEELKDELKEWLPYLENYNLYDLIREHESPRSSFSNLLRISDAKDSAEDRNNPFLSQEQERIEDIYISTVFGYEEKLNISKFEDYRINLFNFLNDNLINYITGKDKFNYDQRIKIIDNLRQYLQKGPGETCRPANDISLWEHGYATSTILKVLITHLILTGELIQKFKDVHFSIFGIGWDGMAYYSQAEKMSDIYFKKKMIEDLKGEIKQIVEFEIPIGNMVYQDDDGIYFLLPPRVSGKEETYDEVIEEIKKKVIKKAEDVLDDELQPIFEIEEDTKFITSIVKVIEKIKKEAIFPYRVKENPLQLSWEKKWKDIQPPMPICPICKKRPADEGKGKICTICLERRKEAQRMKREEEGTMFIDDIADQFGRVCLILCDFELREWLNGNMIRTLLLKEPVSMRKEIESLGRIKGFKDDEVGSEEEKREKIRAFREKKGWANNFSREIIDKEIEMCQGYDKNRKTEEMEYAKDIFFLYDRRFGKIEERFWDELEKEAQEEHGIRVSLSTILLSKMPTPSRLFRVWNETEGFFRDIIVQEIKKIVGTKKRIRLDLEEIKIKPLIIYDDVEVLATGERISLILEDNKVFVIGREWNPDLFKEWHGKKIRIPLTQFDKKEGYVETTIRGVAFHEEFLPFRDITISPNLFMVLVPASLALDISQRIYQKYMERMGKVFSRLPFGLANIFFPKKMAMFAVLDAARRMRKNFRDISKGPRVFQAEIRDKESGMLKLKDNSEEIILLIPSNLGNGEKDRFYPYFIVEPDEELKNEFYLDTPLGKILPWNQVDNRKIRTYVSLYDFEFIDSSAKRIPISYITGNKRYHPLLKDKGLRPYLLQNLDQTLLNIWLLLKRRGISEAQVNSFESLLTHKFFEWQMWLEDEGKRKSWEEFIKSYLLINFQKFLDREEINKFLIASKTGMFFDCLELNAKIVKRKLMEE